MKKFSLRDRHILTALTVILLSAIVLAMASQNLSSKVQGAAYSVLAPMQKGVNRIGAFFTSVYDGFRSASALAEENRTLREKINEQSAEIARNNEKLEELTRLEALLSLKEEYPAYEMVAARVIAKDGGNWYSRFVIDKGSADGIETDMNVLANGGLFGIVTETGEHWARVRSIIDDENNISAMARTTGEICTVTGSLADMTNGTINFIGLRDTDDLIHEGESIVTSNISTKYLPGLLIGQVQSIGKDSNNLTKSGTITPAATFDTLREVLVITEKKETVKGEDD